MAAADQTIMQAIITDQGTLDPNQVRLRLALHNADGSSYMPPSQAVAIADLGAMPAAISGGEPPTEAEFNALRTAVSDNRNKINALLDALRDAGVIDT